MCDSCRNSLLPKEPLKRANVRFAIEYFGTKIAPEPYKYFGNKAENALETFKKSINEALKRVSTDYLNKPN
jgi:glutathione S-transferase